MEPLSVNLSDGRGYSIRFCALRDVSRRAAEAGLLPGKGILVTDDNVNAHYTEIVRKALKEDGWNVLEIVLPPGEKTKSNECMQLIYDRVLNWGIDRGACVFGLGGGVVGDVAGFAAATLLRGLPLVHLPTSLVAQVDSSIGGKTGINHSAGKNLVGASHQPRLVCVDSSTLRTLPQRQWQSGLAEVVKHALIGSRPLFEELEEHWTGILEQDYDRMPRLIRRAAEVKTGIVGRDELEHGRRTWLNFGHTVGHAIETSMGYGRVTHGEAVALGMEAALRLSAERAEGFPLERTIDLVKRLPLSHLNEERARIRSMDFDDLYDVMLFDKKNRAGKRRFVMLHDIADPYVVDDVGRGELEKAWQLVRTIAEE